MEKHLSFLVKLESITGNGSQKIKEKLLAENRSPEMDYILQICYNPFITTKLNKIDYNKTNKDTIDPDLFNNFKTLIEDLRYSPSANNAHRDKAYNLITNSGLSPELQKMLGRIFTKNMNIGLGAKLINKAFGNEVIPDPSLMLAQDDIDRIDKWRKIICEFKYDGVRVIAKIDECGEVSYFTRNFNSLPVKFLKIITEEIKKLANGKTNLFFDGELTDFGRTTVSGKVTSILAGTAPENIGDSFLFNIFDVDDTETLIKGKGTTKYPARRSNLESFFSGHRFSHLILGTKWEINSKEEIWDIYKKIVEVEKGEGVILKDIDHVYTCKRSTSWIKMKEVKDCDLEIVGYNAPNPMSVREENGWIGGFICQTSDKLLTVSVGSGFSEVFLEEIKKLGPNSFIGKIAKVKYNILVEDKKGETSLFLPTLLEIRNDKTEADDFTKLQSKKGKA